MPFPGGETRSKFLMAQKFSETHEGRRGLNQLKIGKINEIDIEF